MYGHRSATGITPRYLELLELLKNEYESMYQEVNMNKMHREDAGHKMYTQLVDISALQKALYELERSHLKMKQHYEDEISKLKHEIEGRGGGPSFVPGTTSAAALIQLPTSLNLEQELQGFASGFANLPIISTAMDTPPPITINSSNSSHPPYGGVPAGMGYFKRTIEDDGMATTHGRNVRPRDESAPRRGSFSQPVTPMPTTTLIPPPPPPHPPSSNPGGMISNNGATSTSNSNSSGGMKKEGPSGSGFDWLVVYNPKASRSITIDLMHTFVHENVVCCVRFSPDGRFLATGSNRVASVYEVKSGELMGTFVDVEGVAVDGDQYVRSVAFSPDGQFLVTGSEDQIVRVWNISTRRLRCKLIGHAQDIYSVDFLPSGKEVVSGSGDRTVRIWDIIEATCKTTLSISSVEAGKDAGITSVAVSPNGKYVAAGSLDRTIRLWEVETGKTLETLEGHRDSVYSVAFAPDGRHLISGSLDKTIKVWQFDSADIINRGTCKYTILGHKDFVLSVAGTPPDGRWVVSGSKDRSVQFWDSLSGTTQLMLQGHKNSVISVAISPVGTYFATGSGDCRARIWSYNHVSPPIVVSPGSNATTSETNSSTRPSSNSASSTAFSSSTPTDPSSSSSSSGGLLRHPSVTTDKTLQD